VPRRVSGGPLRLGGLLGWADYFGLGRILRPGPFLFSLFFFHFFFYLSDLFYIFCIFASI
jgi:hypothetical protein